MDFPILPIAAPEPTLGTDESMRAAGISELRARLATNQRLLRRQAAARALSHDMFEQASAAAKIGMWQCALPSMKLDWSGQVYEIFGLPRGSKLDRAQILELYAGPSREILQDVRSRAIVEGTGFTLDAGILTPKGHRRWIRVTATVARECGAAVRLFGMKQDITEEKLLFERTLYLAEFDVLTGLANRSAFQARLTHLGEQRPADLAFGALLLIDLDGFKQINDGFGHATGDECLKHVSARLRRVCGGAVMVARVGGDEFAVLLSRHLGRRAIERAAARIVGALNDPAGGHPWSSKVSASVGIARVDSCTPDELYARADAALYAAKAAGRNTFRMFDPSMSRAAPPLGARAAG